MFVRLAAVLIIFQLSENWGAAEIKTDGYRLGTPVGDDSKTLPDISFTRVVFLFQKFTMKAQGGYLDGTKVENFKSITEGTVTRQDGSASMTQMIQAKALKGTYNRTKTTLGLLSVLGILVVDLSDSKFNMTMTATADDNGICQLDILLTLEKLGVKLDLDSLGLVGKLLKTLVSVLGALVRTITNTLSSVLPKTVTLLLGAQIGQLLDLDELCKNLLNGDNFTPPIIFSS